MTGYNKCPGLKGKCYSKGFKSKTDRLCYKCRQMKSNDIDIEYESHYSKIDNKKCIVYLLRLNDGTIYVGQTGKSLDQRVSEHKNNPGVTVSKHGGFDSILRSLPVHNRQLAEKLEQFIFEIIKSLGMRVTMGKQNAI